MGCTDNSIKLFKLKYWIILKSLTGLNNEVFTIKKIIYPTFGECTPPRAGPNKIVGHKGLKCII